MKKVLIIFTVCAVLAVPAAVMAFPTVYPTGTTIYKPKKCDNGYTVYGTEVEGEGSVLIDMNGKVVKQWKNMSNREHPVKILEGGYIMGATREKVEHVGRIWDHPESTDMSVMDWDGTPATPQRISTAPSSTRRARSTSMVKSTWPGVSMMLIS